MTKEQISLDKYLSDMGVESRSRLKQLIRKGQVTVNGVTEKRPEVKIIPGQDQVCVSGREISYQKFEYYMLHKPAGVVTATEDRRERTVMELLPELRRKDLFPVGRLDKDTEGLLLLTNDGTLAHRLLSPRHQVDKVYYAKIAGRVTEEDVRAFAEGLDIGDEQPALPARLTILDAEETSEIHVTLTEGRFHQVKRMFEAVGKQVVYLKRLSMGPLLLDESLEKGCCRKLTEEEIRRLREL